MNTEVTAARKAQIRERATALYRSGWYSAEDGKTMMEWMNNGVALASLEGILWEAEAMQRSSISVQPCTQKAGAPQ